MFLMPFPVPCSASLPIKEALAFCRVRNEARVIMQGSNKRNSRPDAGHRPDALHAVIDGAGVVSVGRELPSPRLYEINSVHGPPARPQASARLARPQASAWPSVCRRSTCPCTSTRGHLVSQLARARESAYSLLATINATRRAQGTRRNGHKAQRTQGVTRTRRNAQVETVLKLPLPSIGPSQTRDPIEAIVCKGRPWLPPP